MKQNSYYLFGGLALALAALILSNSGQAQPKPAAAVSASLDQAIALLNAGKAQEAHTIITNIDKRGPAHATARCYDALCQYALDDKRAFLKTLNSPEVQSADLPPAVREDLDLKQLDALFFYRKFEQVLPKTDEFSVRHVGSASLPVVAEFQVAALYEQGMKKITESGQLRARGDVAGAEYRLKEAEANLGRFLKLTADGQRESYQTLANRDLQAEVVKAMTALDGEGEALKLLAPAEREKTALAILQVCLKTKPGAVDENLRRMTNFLNNFPNNPKRQRLQYDMANGVLEEGWRLAWKSKPAQAAPYLDQARMMFSSVVVDKGAGVDETDMMESQKGIMRALYAKQDYAGLSSWVAHCVTNVSAGGKDWLAFKLYDAAGLACQKKTVEAAAELEELLTIGFKNQPGYDGLLVSAAKWRIRVAKMTGDQDTIQRMAQLVEKSDCCGSIKRTFTQNFKELVAEANPLAK